MSSNTTDFIVALNAIDSFYHKNKRYNKQCFEIMDTLSNDVVFEWTEKLLPKRVIEGKEYLTVTGICFQYRTQKFLSKKQKRLLTLKLLEHWDTLSIEYETM
jgi:hypothetical protein